MIPTTFQPGTFEAPPALRAAPAYRHGPDRARGRALRQVAFVALGLALALAALPRSARADTYEDFNRSVLVDDVRTLSGLLARGMDPNTVNKDGEAALLTAAREGSMGSVKALLQAKAKVNVRSPHGDSPIMLAALAGNLPLVKLLREAGAEINHPGWTPLQYAAIGGHNPVIDYLISSGADLGLTAPNGATPVMLAVHAKKAETVRLLIKIGFDLEARNDKGETALVWAKRQEHREIEQILRRAGAKN